MPLCHHWGTTRMDMFTSQLNKKCNLYASRAGYGKDSLGDAFMIPWSSDLLYLFPPLPLVQKTLIRIHQMKVEAILICTLLALSGLVRHTSNDGLRLHQIATSTTPPHTGCRQYTPSGSRDFASDSVENVPAIKEVLDKARKPSKTLLYS